MRSTIHLDGKWQVHEAPLVPGGEDGVSAITAAASEWLDARVPGDIHLDLMRAKRMPEPLEGMNSHECRWVEDKSWWYRRTLRVTKAFLAADRVELVFDGILCLGEVFVNGRLAGVSRNAFVPSRFDVKSLLQAGTNELLVRVTLGTEQVDEHPESPRRWLRDDINNFAHPRMLLRMPQFMFGWDWVQALPNIGIWRSVRLEAYDTARIDDVILSFVDDDRKSHLDAEVAVRNLSDWAEFVGEVSVVLTSPAGVRHEAKTSIIAQPGTNYAKLKLSIPEPELWWPNGLGPQNLHDVAVTLTSGERILDTRAMRYGLRTIELDQSPINDRERRFCLQVNGADVFCRGGNWIPADAIMARCTPERYNTLVELAREANFNMLRVWGGGVYEDDAFYEACDRNGILVWQDFMFACGLYPDHQRAFCDEVRHEAELVIKRLRHHPSLALWCGNNENLWAFKGWWPDEPDGGAIVYGEVLPQVCRALDPDRLYWPSSPCGGEHPNCEEMGDCHWWHPGTMNADLARRVNPFTYDECHAKFVSEYGIIGPPVKTSLRKAVGKDSMQRDSKAFLEHTNTFEKNMLWGGIEHHYRPMEGISLDDYLLLGQMFQSLMYEYSIECLRFREPECQGALIWMYNDCWLEVGWTPLDYYLRRKASYYALKRAYKPVKAIARREGDEIVVRVINGNTEPFAGKVELGWISTDGADEWTHECSVNLPPLGVQEVGRCPLPTDADFDTHACVFGVELKSDGHTVDSTVLKLYPWKDLVHDAPKITVKRRGAVLTITSDVFAHGVHLPDEGKGVLDDNYFDLLPNRPREVRITGDLKGVPKLQAIK